MDESEAGPSRPTPPKLHHSSSDEPQIIETTTTSRRPQRIPRKVSGRPTPPVKPRAAKKATLEKGKAKGKGKEKEKEKEVDVVLVEDSTDEDEPVFVGVASKLAKKYNFKSASFISSTSTGIVVVPDTGPEIDKPKPPPLILHPPLSPQGKPPTIPAWLGKSSILLQIPYCVVCKLRWKKENGAARWVGSIQAEMSRNQSLRLTFQRHISTCLPPLFRPPNPPPDLPRLVHEALLETSGHSTPSLLELHLATVGDPVDNREDIKQDGKKVTKLKGLARMVTVKAADERGDKWEGQVDEAVASVLGSSRLRTPSPSASVARSPFSSPHTTFPSTQPLGQSDLANDYIRQTTPLDERPQTPEMDDDAEIPMPPSSQKRTTAEEEEDERPFRQWGGSRAEGDLPSGKSAIWQDWGCKRYRGDGVGYAR
jgi:hypothetical protein